MDLKQMEFSRGESEAGNKLKAHPENNSLPAELGHPEIKNFLVDEFIFSVLQRRNQKFN